MRSLSSIVLSVLIFALSLSVISCTGKGEKSGTPDSGESNAQLLDISGFTIVRDGACDTSVTKQTSVLKSTVKDIMGIDLAVAIDDDTPYTSSAKEILIGATDRNATESTSEKLRSKTDKEAYIVEISDTSIVIFGSTPAATVRAIKVFTNEYVKKSEKGTELNIDSGKMIMDRFYSKNLITASSGTEFEILEKSTVYYGDIDTWSTGCGYPSIIELQHSGEKNGTLIAAFSVPDSGKRGAPTSFRVYTSTDRGNKWEPLSEAKETIDTSIEACWNPALYELPEDIGELKKGTLLLAGCSIDPPQKRKSHLSIWKSDDCGKSWSQHSVIAEGGGLEGDLGVWEPYLIADGGYLYCFYTDDTGRNIAGEHDQTVVYKRTKDGKTWSDYTEVVAADKPSYRPGMGIITKMGNGKYFIAYEIFGDWSGCPIYYKITDDITKWDASDIGSKLLAKNGYSMGSAPWCAWTPAGGECGTLIVTAKYGDSTPNKILVSFDYGQTFETIDNPLPHGSGTNLGYSASLFFSTDGSILFYGNNVEGIYPEKSQIDFAMIRIFK
ncbi:MAG: exo-alpha-sialidase [Clostridia bacterium]|nr:exo-alpha-sialidase [Clostridia bacterium]